MRVPFIPLAILALPLLAGCGEPLPSRTLAGPPVGSTASSGPVLASQGANPINQDYYIGADPNFPRGMNTPSRSAR